MIIFTLRIDLEEVGFGTNKPVGVRGTTTHDRVSVNHKFKNLPLRHVGTFHNIQLANPWESQLVHLV